MAWSKSYVMFFRGCIIWHKRDLIIVNYYFSELLSLLLRECIAFHLSFLGSNENLILSITSFHCFWDINEGVWVWNLGIDSNWSYVSLACCVFYIVLGMYESTWLKSSIGSSPLAVLFYQNFQSSLKLLYNFRM